MKREKVWEIFKNAFVVFMSTWSLINFLMLVVFMLLDISVVREDIIIWGLVVIFFRLLKLQKEIKEKEEEDRRQDLEMWGIVRDLIDIMGNHVKSHGVEEKEE